MGKPMCMRGTNPRFIMTPTHTCSLKSSGSQLKQSPNVFGAVPLRAPRAGSRRSLSIRAEASNELSTAQTAALVSGAIFNPIILFSEWTLFSTGKGLDPGPAGIYGALEGIGFLVVPGIVLYSLITKARTGSGLPSGPSGALGGVEGVSWLTTLLGIAVFTNEFVTKGALPGITG